MKKLKLLVLVLAWMSSSVSFAHIPDRKVARSQMEITFGSVFSIPRGLMKEDIRHKQHWEMGVASQVLRSPIHIGFNMGVGSYGSFREGMYFIDRGKSYSATMKVTDHVRTSFLSLRVDILRDTRLVPYVQGKFGSYRMSTRMIISDNNSDWEKPRSLSNELMHADNTWIYGGSLGLRFQGFVNRIESRDRFTIDWYLGLTRGNEISYASQAPRNAGLVVGDSLQIGDSALEAREAEWIENNYYGTYLYNNVLNNIETGFRIGLRF